MLRWHLNVATVETTTFLDGRPHGPEFLLGVLGENVVLLLQHRVAREPALGAGSSPFLRRREGLAVTGNYGVALCQYRIARLRCRAQDGVCATILYPNKSTSRRDDLKLGSSSKLCMSGSTVIWGMPIMLGSCCSHARGIRFSNDLKLTFNEKRHQLRFAPHLEAISQTQTDHGVPL
jgi:hypothetical protein